MAFEAAFSDGDDVRLVMACHNPCADERYNAQWEDYYNASPMRGKIAVCPSYFPSQGGVVELMRAADVGLFPARAEGWNLELGEMLALGRRVVCTNYAGHTEFVCGEYANLVEVDRLVPAYDGHWFHGQGAWADLGERQLEQLVEHMRALHKEKRENGSLPNHLGAKMMAEWYTWRHSAEALISALS
jgi:glycosyltransferase involved in cell wall biosynthesis